MARRKLLLAALVAALLGGVAYLNTPPALVSAATTPELPDDIDSYLADAERLVTAQYELIPDTEKRVTWYAEPGARTAYAVVNLHGFSATRQETAPLAERVAASLAANLFETRLSGHGHSERPMHAVRAGSRTCVTMTGCTVVSLQPSCRRFSTDAAARCRRGKMRWAASRVWPTWPSTCSV